MKSRARNSKGLKRSSNGTQQRRVNLVKDTPNSSRAAILQNVPSCSNVDYESNIVHSSVSGINDFHSIFAPPPDVSKMPRVTATSMETEFIEALYPELFNDSSIPHVLHHDLSSSGSDDIDFEGLEIDEEAYGTNSEDGDNEIDGDLGIYDHDDFLSSQEAILLELRREQVEFEENVRQLQEQLQRQGSLLPLLSNGINDSDVTSRERLYSGRPVMTSHVDNERSAFDGDEQHLHFKDDSIRQSHSRSTHVCGLCTEPKSNLCLGKYGEILRPVIIKALATAAAVIAKFHATQNAHAQSSTEDKTIQIQSSRYQEFIPKLSSNESKTSVIDEQQDMDTLSLHDSLARGEMAQYQR
ncbi:hypothetical protein BGZ76_003937 [Entomortierella beljakovae]|nr:hypothetical protein BGZ76_003937 [Entomortierella beljakovae]